MTYQLKHNVKDDQIIRLKLQLSNLLSLKLVLQGAQHCTALLPMSSSCREYCRLQTLDSCLYARSLQTDSRRCSQPYEISHGTKKGKQKSLYEKNAIAKRISVYGRQYSLDHSTSGVLLKIEVVIRPSSHKIKGEHTPLLPLSGGGYTPL
jgi:hypothetical protein